jgi:hypothetical protein
MEHAAPEQGHDLVDQGAGAPAHTPGERRQVPRRWSADDPDRLVAELRARGVRYLSGGREAELEQAVMEAPLQPAELLCHLAASAEPRVRDATIALLLLHPELAGAVADIAQHAAESDSAKADTVTEQVVVLALAAAYLRHIWRTRLTLALGPTPWLPLPQWQAREMPAPWHLDGEWGLRALAERERRRRAVPFNFLSAWQDQVDHLVAQAWMERRPGQDRKGRDGRSQLRKGERPPAAASQRFRGLPHAPRGGSAMSLRQPVDRAAIETFLRRLGSEVHQPGRLYLVGGTTMVYEGYRARTLDIDLLVEADDPGPLLTAIRQLKDALGVNVEFASPGDFIPLPAGWRGRSIWIGRFGDLDVFHFDLYSLVLSKIERGTERDFADALALLKDNRIELDRLDAAFAEVLPRISTEGLGGMDPDRFAVHYQALRDRLGS